jgi:TonB-dependent starch-binding outer membrane protein SusC
MRKILLILMFMGICLPTFAQNMVRGRVIDKSTKEPLPGAAVMAKNTVIGTITDPNGEFSFTPPAGTTDITVSFIGYKNLEMAIAPSLTIELEPESLSLDELVVVGYGVMRKSDLTGSVGKVNVDDLKKASTIDAAEAIQGRLAGVSVISNSGNPGSGVTVRVRGIGTFNNSNPLYVVDGFPVSDISHIAPTDIESMEVLKDASATAIYGSRGANGVILVKTRTGTREKKFEVQVNTFHGISEVAKTLEMADATEFSHAWREVKGGTDAAFAVSDPLVQYVLDSEAAGNRLKGTDWQKEIYRPALSQRYNVTLLGSTDKYSYDHGMTYSSEEGIVKGTYLDKVMFHSNNNLELTKKVKLGMNFNYVWYERPGDNNSDFYQGAIPGALRSDPISTAWDDYTDFYGEIYYSQAAGNPALSIWRDGFNKTYEHRFMAQFFVQIDDIFTKGLSFRSQFGTTMSFNDNKNFSPAYFITPTQKNDDQTLFQSRSYGNSWSNTNYFSYNKQIQKFTTSTTLGAEVQASESSNIWARGYDVPMDEDLRYLGAAKDKELFGLGGGAGHSRIQSAFFRTNVTFDNRFLATATVRWDGTSRFTEEQRWGTFPSFSAGWNIANESFMAPLQSTISTLKLRAGWGKVGNQSSAGEFDYVSSVNGGYVYALNGAPVEGSVQQMLANEELHWESSEQLNFGIDYGLFDNKMTGSIDYFIRTTNDMIISRPIPMYAGKQRPSVNAGTMENSGLEFSVNYSNHIGELKYSVGFNITALTNEVTSLAGGDPIRSGGVGRSGNTTRTSVGKEIAYFYGYKTDGIFNDQAKLDAHNQEGVAIQPTAELGDVKFLDLNKDGKITEDDMTYLGSATPDFTGGFNLNLAYKNIDMTLFLYGSYGNEIVNSMYQSLYSSRMFETNISRDMAVNHWTPLNPNSDIPRLTSSDPNKNDSYFSDRWVEDGSYLRVKNLQIGYTLPESLSQKVSVKNMRVYASFDNLITFTNYSGLDPEMFGLYGNPFYYGVDMVNYPQPRTYSIGLNLTF